MTSEEQIATNIVAIYRRFQDLMENDPRLRNQWTWLEYCNLMKAWVIKWRGLASDGRRVFMDHMYGEVELERMRAAGHSYIAPMAEWMRALVQRDLDRLLAPQEACDGTPEET